MTALSGLRVVDLTEGVSGPYCTKLLAGFGADVLKVEPPGGETGRRAGPFPDDEPHPERSGRFLHLNTGKRGVTLDVAAATGRRLLDRLLADADVLVLDGAPLRLSERGLDPDGLADAHQNLVITAISPFGRSGPYRDFSGSEIVLYAMGGYLTLTGDPDKPPIKAYGTQAEYQAGLHAALGTLLALRLSDTTAQRGQVVDVAGYEAALFLLGGPAQVVAVQGEDLKRNGTRLIGLGDHHPYPSTLRPCLGGWVHAHSNNRHWDLVSILMENPDLAAEHLIDAPTRHADEIDALMDAWLADKDKFEVVRRAQELRVPFTEVMTVADVLAEPHYQERGFWAEVERPHTPTLRMPGAPTRLSATPWLTRAAPLLGDANTNVYENRLGLPAFALARLRAAQVL